VIAVAGVAVIVVAFVLLRGGNSNDSTSKTTPTVNVVNAKPQGGVQKLTFKKGGTVKFHVVSDTADEIHVHGYDVHKDVAKSGTITFDFPAKIDGRFVVELEGSSTQIAELDVTP
jgi:alpha-D-ribose 1-methylphosphonate 5-phosphate C-P lyase